MMKIGQGNSHNVQPQDLAERIIKIGHFKLNKFELPEKFWMQ